MKFATELEAGLICQTSLKPWRKSHATEPPIIVGIVTVVYQRQASAQWHLIYLSNPQRKRGKQGETPHVIALMSSSSLTLRVSKVSAIGLAPYWSNNMRLRS